MKVLLNILGGIFLLGAIVWGIYLVVAVATHMEGYDTFADYIPGIAGHAVAMFLGMVFIGLGQRMKQPVTP